MCRQKLANFERGFSRFDSGTAGLLPIIDLSVLFLPSNSQSAHQTLIARDLVIPDQAFQNVTPLGTDYGNAGSFPRIVFQIAPRTYSIKSVLAEPRLCEGPLVVSATYSRIHAR